MTLIVFSIFFFLVQQIAFSQSEPRFIRTYGAINTFNYGLRLSVLSDTTYMLLSNKSGFMGNNNIYLIHVDKNGMIIKDKVFGDNELWFATDMAYNDSIFWICGYSLNKQTHDYDIIVLKVDKWMNVLNKKIFGYADWDMGQAIAIDKQQNTYILASTYYGNGQAIYLTKLDSEFNIVSTYHIFSDTASYEPKAITVIGDTLVYICGHLSPYTGDKIGFIYKFDVNLNLLDNLFLSESGADICLYDIDGDSTSILITGKWSSNTEQTNRFLYGIYDLFLQQQYFELSASNNDWCNCIKKSKFSSLIVIGGVSYVYGAGSGDFLFLVFDDQWYVASTTIGKSLYEEVFDCDFALDSTIVLIGTTRSYGQTYSSIMFAKTCKTYNCQQDHLHQTNIQSNQHNNTIKIYPNPAHDVIYINFSDNSTNFIQLSIYSKEGHNLSTSNIEAKNNKTFIHSIANLPAGIYLLKIKTDKFLSYSKLIKL